MRKDFIRHEFVSGMNSEVFCNSLNDMIKKNEELFFKTTNAGVFSNVIETELEVCKSKVDYEFKLIKFDSLMAKVEYLNANKIKVLQELRIESEVDLDYVFIIKVVKEEEKK